MTSILVDVTSVSTLSASGNFTAGAVAAAPTVTRNVAIGSFVGLRQSVKHGGGGGQRTQVETPVITAARSFTGKAALQFNSDSDRTSFQKFDGLQGEGSLRSVLSLSNISTKKQATAFAVRASSAVTDPTAVTDSPAAAAPSKQKIRIKLRSYWVHLIQQACQQILDAAKNTNAQTMGPVPLPTKRRVYCVLRSPHVDKDSREHFEIRTHHRLIDLANPNAQTIDALMQLDLPAGVDVEVKLS